MSSVFRPTSTAEPYMTPLERARFKALTDRSILLRDLLRETMSNRHLLIQRAASRRKRALRNAPQL